LGQPRRTLCGQQRAAALQLLKENIPYLVRIQRLAAIGAALSARPDAPPLSPSGLRALLKHPLVSGDNVRSHEDPYDDVYVEEVAFHGGPRLVMQGLTSRSAHTLRILLSAIFSPVSLGLPRPYVQQARTLVQAVLTLSNAICVAAGLRSGTAAPRLRRREPFVPGREQLAELRDKVTFTSAELAELLPARSLQAVNGWIVGAGDHQMAMDAGSDDALILTPLLRHGSDVIGANPGELAPALRRHRIVLAMDHGCPGAVGERRDRLRPPRHPHRPPHALQPPPLPLPHRSAPAAQPLPPNGPAKSLAKPSPGSCPTTSSPTTATGSATSAVCASSCTSSKNSAWPSSKPTHAGTTNNAKAGPPIPGKPAHNTVDAARLTCGQPPDQPANNQLKPKREDLTTWFQVTGLIAGSGGRALIICPRVVRGIGPERDPRARWARA